MSSADGYKWDLVMALVGPARRELNIGAGSADGSLPSGATQTREILIGGTSDGNIRCKFANSVVTSVTIPVKAGQRYPWCLTKVFSTSTTVTGIWGFY